MATSASCYGLRRGRNKRTEHPRGLLRFFCLRFGVGHVLSGLSHEPTPEDRCGRSPRGRPRSVDGGAIEAATLGGDQQLAATTGAFADLKIRDFDHQRQERGHASPILAAVGGAVDAHVGG